MLFAYIYVPHQMEKMQSFIDFIFYEVWCKAPVGLVFHPDLFEGNLELKEVMSEFGFSAQAAERGKAFYKDVKAIYELFASLSTQEIDQFKQWYQGNNDIEKICLNDSTSPLLRYTNIPVAHKALGEQFASFFKGLYSKSLLGLVVLQKIIGDMDGHYKTFVQTNNAGKCPFCGINDLFSKYHSPREAYDHYLPKSLYPFNSINFKNLVPACHDCNSSYKTSKDPASTVKDPAGDIQRRKFFYPYRSDAQAIEIIVDIAKADISSLTLQDIKMQYGPVALTEEIDTWRDVYGIDERFKAKLLGENDGKFWVLQVLDEWRNDDKAPEEFINTLARQAKLKPFASDNFIKLPFLDGCKRVGLFDSLP